MLNVPKFDIVIAVNVLLIPTLKNLILTTEPKLSLMFSVDER